MDDIFCSVVIASDGSGGGGGGGDGDGVVVLLVQIYWVEILCRTQDGAR